MSRTVKMRVYMARADGSRVTVKRERDIASAIEGSVVPSQIFSSFMGTNIGHGDTVLEASYTLVQTDQEFSESRSGGSRYQEQENKR